MIHVKQVVQDFIISNICQEKEKGKKEQTATHLNGIVTLLEQLAQGGYKNGMGGVGQVEFYPHKKGGGVRKVSDPQCVGPPPHN